MDLQIIVLGVWLNLLNKCCVHMFNKKSYANSVFDWQAAIEIGSADLSQNLLHNTTNAPRVLQADPRNNVGRPGSSNDGEHGGQGSGCTVSGAKNSKGAHKGNGNGGKGSGKGGGNAGKGDGEDVGNKRRKNLDSRWIILCAMVKHTACNTCA